MGMLVRVIGWAPASGRLPHHLRPHSRSLGWLGRRLGRSPACSREAHRRTGAHDDRGHPGHQGHQAVRLGGALGRTA